MAESGCSDGLIRTLLTVDTSYGMAGGGDRATWTAAAESALITFLVNARSSGIQSDNNFKPQVYTAAALALQAAAVGAYSNKQIKSRWGRFKEEFKIVKTLRGLSGFGWDDKKKVVTASAQVWDAYLKGHPKAAPFRKKAFPLYDDIGKIIGNTAATGSFAVSSANTFSPPDEPSSDPAEPSEPDLSSDPAPSAGECSTGTQDLTESESDKENEVQSASDKPTKTEVKKSGKRDRSLSVGSATASGPPKRSRTSGAGAISRLSSSIDTLVTGLFQPPAPTVSNNNLSTPLKDRAFNVVCEEEGFTPRKLANARRVFRAPDLAEEYLSFKRRDLEARKCWLLGEIGRLPH